MRRMLSAVILLLVLLSAMPVLAEEGETGASPDERAPVDVGLDPGHSDADVGAVGGGFREADLTLALALRVRDLLQQQGLTVAMSRLDNRPLTDYTAPFSVDQIRLEQQARVAAVLPARVYVSLHFNGFGDPRVRGTETYYNGDNHGEESRALARSIEQRLVSELLTAGYDVPVRGVKEDLAAGKSYGHFFGLRGGLPSVLVESLFLSNPREAALLADDPIREALAHGIGQGIADYLSTSGSAPATP